MDIIESYDIYSWDREIECETCGTRYRIEILDLKYDEFKTEGYFFNGTDRCEGHCYVNCPMCERLTFVDNTHPLVEKAVKEGKA